MTPYSIILFLHVGGALGFFFALGLEWVCYRELRRAKTAEKALEWMTVARLLRRVYPVSAATLLITGVYLATSWGEQPWILVGLASLVILAVVGAAITGPRMRALGGATAQAAGPVSATIRRRLHDPLLRLSLHVRLAVAIAVVYLMTVKPGLGDSLGAVGVAAFLGMATSLLRRSGSRSVEPGGRVECGSSLDSVPRAGRKSGAGPRERDHLLALAEEIDALHSGKPATDHGTRRFSTAPSCAGSSTMASDAGFSLRARQTKGRASD